MKGGIIIRVDFLVKNRFSKQRVINVIEKGGDKRRVKGDIVGGRPFQNIIDVIKKVSNRIFNKKHPEWKQDDQEDNRNPQDGNFGFEKQHD